MPHTYRDLLKEPLTTTELEDLASLGNLGGEELLNLKSQVFKKMQLPPENLSKSKTLELLAEFPRIIIRPLLTDGERLLSRFKEEEYALFTARS